MSGDKAAGAWTPWPVVDGQLDLDYSEVPGSVGYFFHAPVLPEDGQHSDQGERDG